MLFARAVAGLLFVAGPGLPAAAEPRLPDLPSMEVVRAAVPLDEMEQVRVSMSVRSVFTGDRYDISDRESRIEMSVDRDFGRRSFRFGGNVGNRYLTGTVEASADGSWYRVWGSGLSLDMRKWGTGWQVTGFMDEETGSQHMDVTLRQQGLPGSYSVWDHGVNLNISKFGWTTDISGDIRPRQFGRRSLAMLGVFVAVLQAELDKPAPNPPKP